MQALLTWHRPVSFSSGGYHLGRTVASLFGEHAGGGAAGAAAQAPGGDGPVNRSNHADRMDDEPDFPPPVIALGPSWSESDFLTTDQLVEEIGKTRALLKSLGIGGEEKAANVTRGDDRARTPAEGGSDQGARTAALPAAPISVTAPTEADLPVLGLPSEEMAAANTLPADLVQPASATAPASAGDFTVNESFVNGTNALVDFREPASGTLDSAEEPWSNPMGDPSGQGVPDYASMPPYVSSTSYGEQMAQLGAGAEDLAIGIGKGIVNGVPNLVFDAGKGWAYAGAAAWDIGRYALGTRYDGFATLWDTYGALSPLNADILDYNDRLQQAGGFVGGFLSPAAYGKAISVLGSASSGGAAFLRGLGVPDFKIGLPAYNPNVLYSNPIPLALAAVDPLAEVPSEIRAVGDALQNSAVAGAASGTDQIAEGGLRAEDAVAGDPNAAAETGQLSQIQLNAQNGAAFQARVANYGADKFENFLEEVSIRPNTEDGVADFRVRVDGLGATPETEALGLLDAKSSETAPLTARQAEGYPLIQQYGGTVVGNNGLPHYPAGTKILPTEVQIIKPSDLPEGY